MVLAEEIIISQLAKKFSPLCEKEYALKCS
jgi:hypothetical protein